MRLSILTRVTVTFHPKGFTLKFQIAFIFSVLTDLNPLTTLGQFTCPPPTDTISPELLSSPCSTPTQPPPPSVSPTVVHPVSSPTPVSSPAPLSSAASSMVPIPSPSCPEVTSRSPSPTESLSAPSPEPDFSLADDELMKSAKG